MPPSPHDAVQSLYGGHHRWLCGWLRQKLGCAHQAADLAHDTFVRVLTRQRELAAVREPRAYLTTIARGLVIDHWRRQEVERAWLETVAHLPEPEAPSEETRAMIVDTLLAIDAMLGRLKPAVREAFLLAQFEGLTCPQIAERLGVSRATVERHLAAALRHCYRLAGGE